MTHGIDIKPQSSSMSSRSYIIFDIAKVDGERMNLVLCPLNPVKERILAGPEDCLNCRVEFLANL